VEYFSFKSPREYRRTRAYPVFCSITATKIVRRRNPPDDMASAIRSRAVGAAPETEAAELLLTRRSFSEAVDTDAFALLGFSSSSSKSSSSLEGSRPTFSYRIRSGAVVMWIAATALTAAASAPAAIGVIFYAEKKENTKKKVGG
jgi:hypothetical protein